LKLMAWAKAKTAIIATAGVILATGTTVIVVKEIAPGGGSDGRGPVQMQMKWQAGKKYAMHRETIQTETKTQSKQVQKMTQDFSLSLVRDLDNGGQQLQLEFESLALEVTVGDRKAFSADSTQSSAQDARNPVGARLRRMVGAHLQYFVNANGKVEKMEGYSELVKQAAGENPKDQAAFRDLFNESVLQKFGSFGEDSTPHRVGKLGDSWPIHLEDPSGAGLLNVDLKCTFKNWERHGDRRCMRVIFAGTVQAAPNAASLPVKIENGRVSGETWFDPKLEMIVEIAFEADMNLKITRQGQTVTSPLNQKTRFTLVDVEDLAK
jgi:hypothetical protein